MSEGNTGGTTETREALGLDEPNLRGPAECDICGGLDGAPEEKGDFTTFGAKEAHELCVANYAVRRAVSLIVDLMQTGVINRCDAETRLVALQAGGAIVASVVNLLVEEDKRGRASGGVAISFGEFLQHVAREHKH